MSLRSIPGRRLRGAITGAAVVAAVLLGAACGGGTSQYETFVAQRLLVFGDETSALTDDGRKFSINGTVTDSNNDGTSTKTIDCRVLPNFAQTLASNYGFVFAECNTDASVQPRGVMRAQSGAKVADVSVQIDGQVANGGFRSGDLTTVLAGANDIIELYAQFPGRSESDLADELRSRGRRLAQQVNRLVDFGAKVLIVTVPDMGVTPFALQQRIEFGDTNRAALLTRLTSAFNEQLGANVVLDGRSVGLVQGDVRIQAMAKSPSSFGLANATDAACDVAVPLVDCSDDTLAAGASASTWLWSDSLHLAFAGGQQLATLAFDRARRNPF